MTTPDPAFWSRMMAQPGEERARKEAAVNQLTRQVVLEALEAVGAKEVGHNDGPEVREWLRRVYREPGRPWCAAFAWCMLDNACLALGLANPFPPTAGVHLFVARAKNAGAWTAEPGPGFVCFHDSSRFGAKLGHCGIVTEVFDGLPTTVEGNTNEAGSREGDTVVIKTRPAGYWDLGYMDPAMLFRDK